MPGEGAEEIAHGRQKIAESGHHELRDTYARTLDEDAAAADEAAFDRAASKRFPRLRGSL